MSRRLISTTLGNHTLFLVDFGSSDSVSPPCGQERRLRGRRCRLAPVEQEERAWTRAELLRLEEARALGPDGAATVLAAAGREAAA